MSPTETRSSSDELFEIEVESAKDCSRRLSITVEPAHVAATRRAEGAKVGRSAKIKGFRKGKVPSHVVEERYGTLIDERTLTTLVNEGFRAAVRRHGLEAVGEPRVDDVEYEPGERLSFRVDVEVMPSVELARTGGFRVQRPEIPTGEEEIEEILEKMREDHAVLEPVDRAPEPGDVVSVVIRSAGEADLEEKPYRFELGAGYAIPDVESAILTLEPGEEGTFEVRYPEDFGAEELAGRSRSLSIRLDDVRAKRLPELDDEFARGIGDFESMEELRSAVAQDVRAHHEREAEDAVREKLIDEIIAANPFDVPRSLLSRYLDRVIEAPEDADPERVEEARRSVAPAVERQIKRDLILERLIETEELAPTAEEVEARLEEIAEKRDVTAAEVRRRLAREKQLDALRQRLAVDKAFEALEERSEIR